MSRLSDLLVNSVRLHCTEQALADTEGRLTYAELSGFVGGTGFKLQGLGVRRGDHIAVMSENCKEYIILYLALLRLGAVVVPIDISLGKDKVDYIVNDCCVKKVIHSRLAAQDIGTNYLKIDDLISSQGDISGCEQTSEEDTACIIYTTGSTGFPKGVVLRHRNVFTSIANISDYIGYDENFRELCALPLSHSFGLNQVLSNLYCGGFVYIIKGFGSVKKILQLLQSEGITSFPGTPTSYKLTLGRFTERFKEASSELRHVLINSSPLAPKDARFILENLPKVRLMVYYGLTEASRSTFHTHSLDSNDNLLSSVGKAAPGVELAIVDEAGARLSRGRSGEVLIKSDAMMKEYWQDPQETAKSISEGWLKSGDIGYIDDDGYLFLTGRIKDQINVGGLKVSSAEIMQAIDGFDGVAESYVFSRDDELLGEVPVACVVAERELSKDELISALSQRLESFKIPKEVYFVDKIPRSNTGKVLKHEITEMIEGKSYA